MRKLPLYVLSVLSSPPGHSIHLKNVLQFSNTLEPSKNEPEQNRALKEQAFFVATAYLVQNTTCSDALNQVLYLQAAASKFS